MTLASLLSRWRADPETGGNVVEWRTLPRRAARYSPLPAALHPALQAALRAQHITALYLHQGQAWQHAQNGENVVVVTGTASGKTLCYNLPVLDDLLRGQSARALYLFPTKALAQDQLAGLNELLQQTETGNTFIAPAVYDGDTPSHLRPTLRANTRLLISNPDMLHTGILPHHTGWVEFFRNLRWVVIDEMHTYRGVFGSHLANVIRRLKRIAHHYGAAPQFLLTSATIANPAELAQWIIEAPVSVLDEDGSARGQRDFLIYNPPVVDPDLGIRRSVTQEATRLADELIAQGVQTILFGQSRRGVEIMLSVLRAKASDASLNPVRAYRSGYLPSHRREIEQGLRDGSVRAVVATNALELGIDIGGMGAAILAGYPGSIASSRQQMGRAGRGEAPSLAVLITSASPLDQYLAHHPEYFFERSPEQALVNPNHLLILLGHLRCAAFELPFRLDETFGSIAPGEFLEFLKEANELHYARGQYFWMAEGYPAQRVSLRSASPENVTLQYNGTTIGQVDTPSAAWMVHPGAVYLHEGQTYLVEQLDLEEGRAFLKNFDGDYSTEPRRETTVQLVALQDQRATPGGSKAHGEITVTTQVMGFRRVKRGGGAPENLGFEPLDLPPFTLQTTGYWIALSDETIEQLQADGLWRSAPNDYGPGWAALARRVRARDGFRCQACGVMESDRAHDVHHKIPLRAFGVASDEVNGPRPANHLEQANQMSNLVTLCPSCHRKAETAVRVRSGLGGLGYLLGNLAPLFLMCDPRDLGVNADPQSPLAEGKPAIVIYDQVPAGIGFSERLFELHQELVQRAREVAAGCACADGCPSCVGPAGENGYGGRRETQAILEALQEKSYPKLSD